MTNFLFIDAENMYLSESELLYLNIIYKIDKIFIYFDMEKNNLFQHYSDWTFKYECYFVNVPSYGGKNSVDLQISIDILEHIFLDKNLKSIIIASNDRDFLPICKKIIGYKKKMIIVGSKFLCKDIIDLVDSFVLVDHIPMDLKIILLCFLYMRKNNLSISQIKKLIKKMNKKKNIQEFSKLDQTILKWHTVFDITENNDVILKYNF